MRFYFILLTVLAMGGGAFYAIYSIDQESARLGAAQQAAHIARTAEARTREASITPEQREQRAKEVQANIANLNAAQRLSDQRLRDQRASAPTQQERDQGAIAHNACIRNTQARYAREQGTVWLDSLGASIRHCDNLFRNVPR